MTAKVPLTSSNSNNSLAVAETSSKCSRGRLVQCASLLYSSAFCESPCEAGIGDYSSQPHLQNGIQRIQQVASFLDFLINLLFVQHVHRVLLIPAALVAVQLLCFFHQLEEGS